VSHASLKVTLSEFTIREKIEFARRIAEAVPAYPSRFPSPPFPQVETEAALHKLEVAYDAARLARMMAHRKDELLQEAETALDLALRQQLDYIESTSCGDITLLRNMGLGSRISIPVEATDASGPAQTEQWW
jgi:hypothetical protein